MLIDEGLLKRFLGILIYLLAPTLYGQDHFTLQAALLHAFKESPYVDVEKSTVAIAEAEALKARGLLLPQLNIQGSIQQREEPRRPDESQRASEYSFRLVQPIFAGGSRYYQWQSARSLHEANIAGANFSLQNLKLEITRIYLSILAGTEVLMQQQQLVEVLKNQLKVVRARFDAGLAVRSDTQLAEARFAAAEGAATLARSQLEISRAQLVQYLGFSPTEPLVWPEIPLNLPDKPADLYEKALGENPLLLQSKAIVDSEQAGYKAARGAFFPEFTAELHRTRRFDQSELPEHQSAIVLGMSLNLFNGLQSYYERKQEGIELQRAEDRATIVKKELEQQSTAVFSQLQAAKSNLESLRIAVSSANEAAEAFSLEYKSGLRGISDVLDTEQDVLQAQVSLIQARFEYYLAAYRILYVAGKL